MPDSQGPRVHNPPSICTIGAQFRVHRTDSKQREVSTYRDRRRSVASSSIPGGTGEIFFWVEPADLAMQSSIIRPHHSQGKSLPVSNMIIWPWEGGLEQRTMRSLGVLGPCAVGVFMG
jgi:hypothetical protein